MSPSQNCFNLIETFEGCVLTAYQDANGVWTIGYGHTQGVSAGITITQKQAQAFLESDVQMAAQCVDGKVGPRVTQNQFDALCSFVFNVGCSLFSTSTMLREINTGSIMNAADEFDRWVYAGSQVLPGLIKRRATEKALFLRASA